MPPLFVGRWKMRANVAESGSAKHGIRNRVGDGVRVRVPGQSSIVLYLDAAQDEFAAVCEPMRVVADSYAHRGDHGGKARALSHAGPHPLGHLDFTRGSLWYSTDSR